jgi:hypothetical protein
MNFGGRPGAPGAPGAPAPIPGPGGDGPGDPAEQAAVDVINRHGGSVTREGGRVVSVGIFRDTFTDNELKELATLTKTKDRAYLDQDHRRRLRESRRLQ